MLNYLLRKKLTGALCFIALTIHGTSHVNATANAIADGVWWRDGYGKVIEIENQRGVEYQFTRASCLKTGDIEAAEIQSMADRLASSDSNTLYLLPESALGFQERYRRVDALPASCLDERLIRSGTASNSFEHFWHSINDYYAFLDQRQIDWAESYSSYVNAFNDGVEDDELFDIFATMLGDFDDRHVQISNDVRSYTPAKTRGATLAIEESFAQQSEYEDLQTYSSAVRDRYRAVRDQYLDQDSIQVIDGALPARITWATMQDGELGYLHVANMALLTAEDYGYGEASNLEVIRSLMPKIITDLQDTQAMIIDIRDNSGGFDSVAFTIASYFTDQTRKVVSKVARSYAGETAPLDFYLEPAASSTYLKPVIIVAGAETTSAAEVFLITMRALPQVTVIGEVSRGNFSDILVRRLPNTWSLWLSNEVYRDARGAGYEVVGVPPDFYVPTFSLAAMELGVNLALEAGGRMLAFKRHQQD